MTHILEADGIQLEFDGRKILSGIYVKCETGKITGLLGRNGQGKSCLMNIIYGSLSSEKSVRIDRKSIPEGFRNPDLIRYLPQFHFIPHSLSLHRIFRDFDVNYRSFQVIFPEFIHREKDSIGKLSGGERRLVELYTIIQSNSQFIMLDEPFTMLNPLQIEKVKALLIEEKKNKGILMTDHLYRHIVDLADSLYLLSNGRTVLTNSVEDLTILGYTKL